MTQNHCTARRAESLAGYARKDSLREETHRTLSDIAYVLHLTGRVKKAILEEKTPVAVN